MRDHVRLKRVVEHRGITGQNGLLLLELRRVELCVGRAQELEQRVNTGGRPLLAECQEFPEALRRRDILIRGDCRVEDIMEPFLCLGKALIVREVYRDHHGDMKENLPIVVGVGPADCDVEGLVEIVDANGVAFD